MSTPVTLCGRLVRDPELTYARNGTPVARFTVVTSRRVKDAQTGEWSDKDTTFWECVAFKQTAENVAESLLKGTAVIVQGNAAQEEWEDREGNKRRTVKVTVDDVAPSLRWASAKVKRAERSTVAHPRSDDPWAGGGDAPPF